MDDPIYWIESTDECVGDNDDCWAVMKRHDGVEDVVGIVSTEFLADKLMGILQS